MSRKPALRRVAGSSSGLLAVLLALGCGGMALASEVAGASKIATTRGPLPQFDDKWQSDTFEHKGFHVQVMGIDGVKDLTAVEAMVRGQIDILEQTGMPTETMNYLRRFPIKAHADRSAELGHYSGEEFVRIAALPHLDDRPILLHEYMHLFHHRRLQMGEHNPDIIRFYLRAKEGHLYSSQAYMLSNSNEFFAMTASTLLNGCIARPPFTRTNLEKRQPEYYSFLKHLLLSDRPVSKPTRCPKPENIGKL